jgi:hypothetical protein
LTKPIDDDQREAELHDQFQHFSYLRTRETECDRQWKVTATSCTRRPRQAS